MLGRGIGQKGKGGFGFGKGRGILWEAAQRRGGGRASANGMYLKVHI